MWYSTSQARVYSASLHVKTMLTWSARPIDVDSIYFFSVQCMVTVFTGHLRSVHVHGHRPYTRTITFEQNNLWPRYIFDSLVHLHPIYVQYPGQGHGRSSRSQEEMLLKWSVRPRVRAFLVPHMLPDKMKLVYNDRRGGLLHIRRMDQRHICLRLAPLYQMYNCHQRPVY